MRTATRTGLFVTIVLLLTGMVASSAFTTATLERDTNIDVVADDQGIIALTDGNSGGIVDVDSSTGELTIDFAVGSASGVNVNSTYELGDPNDPTSEMAFDITNQDSVAHTIGLNYTVDTGDGVGDPDSSVQFRVYDSTGSQVATEDEESGTDSFTAASGETFHVVVIVDTTVGGVDQSSDLSGTLHISGS